MKKWLSVFSMMALLGCNGTGAGKAVSSDIRIDGAGDNDNIDSAGVEMCAADEGQVYVAWYDDRDGKNDIWLNYSLDGGRSWLEVPIKVNHSENGAAVDPVIGCDGNRVYVAWEDERDGELENHNIYFNYSANAGQSWEAEDQLLDGDPDGRTMSLGAQIATWNSRVYVAWFDSANGAYDIYLASSADEGESFGEPVRVDSDSPGSAYSAYPQLGVAENGNVYVVWEDSRDELSDIYFSYSGDFGASFSNDFRLDGGDDAGSNDSFSPKLAVEGSNAYVIWHDDRNGDNRDIYMNWSSDSGGTWQGEALRVDGDVAGFSDSIYPSVVAYEGSALLTWQDARNGAGYDIYHRSFLDGTFSSDEVRLDLGDGQGYSNSLNPKTAVGENGLIVAWQDLRYDEVGEGYNDIFYNYSLDVGASFHSNDLRIDNVEAGSKFADELSVAVQRQRILAVWRDGRRGNSDIFFHGMKVGKEAEYKLVGKE